MRKIGLERVEVEGKDGGPSVSVRRREQLVRMLWELACCGNMRAARLLLEYCEGKPVQVVDLEARAVPAVSGDDLAAALRGAEEWERAALSGGTEAVGGTE